MTQSSSFRGNAALSSDHSTLIVDNLLNRSFDVYFIPSIARPASLAFSAKPRYPRQCIFSENAKIAVCGSTINKVYVVDVTANEIVQTLEAGEGEQHPYSGISCSFTHLDRYLHGPNCCCYRWQQKRSPYSWWIKQRCYFSLEEIGDYYMTSFNMILI